MNRKTLRGFAEGLFDKHAKEKKKLERIENAPKIPPSVHRRISDTKNGCRHEYKIILGNSPYPDGTDRICVKCLDPMPFTEMLRVWNEEGKVPPNDLRANTLDRKPENR
jgi:hypothetical protein